MASVGKPLPWSLREAIWKLLADGRTHRAIAAELQVSTRTVLKYSRGKCTAKPCEHSKESLS